MKKTNILKLSIIISSLFTIASCASSNSGDIRSEVIIVHTSSNIDPSIKLDKKDKGWLKIKNDESLLARFDQAGSPKIVYSTVFNENFGVKHRKTEVNKIKLDSINKENEFTKSKIDFKSSSVKKDWKSFNTEFEYRIDVMSDVKYDSMSLKKYPKYETFKYRDNFDHQSGKYNIISNIVMEDKSNLFIINKVK